VRVQATNGQDAMTDSGLQRLNLVESQVRPSDVTDRRIIKAMLDVPREAFVPSALASIAYMEEPVSVAGKAPNGVETTRQLLAPRTFAKLVQLARIDDGSVVLDVGCATGYSTAVLAKIAAHVVAVESDKLLADMAGRTLQKLGVENASVIVAPLVAGAPARAPFDAIVLNGSVPVVPDALLDQLKEGGRLVAVIADGALSRAHIILRSRDTFDARPAFEAAAAQLPGFEKPAAFVF
jgi:protein-L-isoaspartate(D-aspartate) O-methyltransferase